MQMFKRAEADPIDPANSLEAYREGRRDERRLIETSGPDHKTVKRELDEAYERGRREGLSRRRGSALGAVSAVLLLVLIVGTGVMVMHYGSFAAAGGAVDQALSTFA
jgi:hypothetical protein